MKSSEEITEVLEKLDVKITNAQLHLQAGERAELRSNNEDHAWLSIAQSLDSLVRVARCILVLTKKQLEAEEE